MKKLLLNAALIAALSISCSSPAQQEVNWQPAGDKIMTTWGENIDPLNVLPEYPRPAMERKEWKNLNGIWQYAITGREAPKPEKYDGEILVPFPVESSLSGVGLTVGEEKELWYERTFKIPASWRKKEILLNFGAVDWKSEVWINDILVGSHIGGYTPFSLNITEALDIKGDNTLVVKVWDPTNAGYQPRGKQVANPRGIWYTSVTGIWQTVWLEPVASKHIVAVKPIPDIDSERLNIEISLSDTVSSDDIIEIILSDNGTKITSAKCSAGEIAELYIKDMKLWSPETPFLYDMEVILSSKGKTADKVKSYAAMRKISVAHDADGIMRMQLNNVDYFHFGPLDQGWWPDGLYTAPSDEALLYDIRKTKELGFNMIRKHVKVEPARWYTHCDREGILVWQDMPNGDKSPKWVNKEYFNAEELERSPESEANYRKEWKEIVDLLRSHPSIVVWVPFNEAWGQFKTQEIAEWTKSYDPSRLINSASGGNHYHTGEILDLHNYPGPAMYMHDPDRVMVLGEYGGIGLPVEGHLWQPDRNWGYIQFKNTTEVTDEYVKYAKELKEMISKGFSGAVYTQTTDVEIEVNGLMTYDRKVIKVEEERVRKINREICNSLTKKENFSR